MIIVPICGILEIGRDWITDFLTTMEYKQNEKNTLLILVVRVVERVVQPILLECSLATIVT